MTGHDGFITRDGEAFPLTGVWFADGPVGVNEGAADDPSLGDPVLAIEIDEAAVEYYEICEDGKPYREWCIPAHLANAHLIGVITVSEDSEDGA